MSSHASTGAVTGVLPLLDLRPRRGDLRAEVLAGLLAPRKTLPPKLFYDAAGSALFDRICTLPEYYPTRTEHSILARDGAAIARRIGKRALVIGFGTGCGTKTRRLLAALDRPAGYVAVDIAPHAVTQAAESLAKAFPDLSIQPVCADYMRPLPLGAELLDRFGAARRVAFFPGSTIGNLTPREAHEFLARVRALVGRGGALLVGYDLVKDRALLEAAYDDAEGVTAAFDKNALAHVNRLLGADFDLDLFEHRAGFDPDLSRVEMHLVSTVRQDVHLGDLAVHFEPGESIHTENSYKWTRPAFASLAARAGFATDATWTDPREWFAVSLLSVA